MNQFKPRLHYADKIGTRTTFLVLGLPKYFFGSWTTYLGSPRTKKVVRYQKLSVV
jgi:hypothetical protein